MKKKILYKVKLNNGSGWLARVEGDDNPPGGLPDERYTGEQKELIEKVNDARARFELAIRTKSITPEIMKEVGETWTACYNSIMESQKKGKQGR